MSFDPSYPQIGNDIFPQHDWSHTPHTNAKESIPENGPDAKGLEFTIVAFVDYDHVEDIVTRKSRTAL